MKDIIDIYKEEYNRTGCDKLIDIIAGLVYGSVEFWDTASQLSIRCDDKSQPGTLNSK